MLSEWTDARRGYLSGLFHRAIARRGIRVFRYHGVVERRGDTVLHRNQHDLRSFREQIRYLRRFRVIGLDELVPEIERRDDPAVPTAVLTFDDGFANNLIVGEVLRRYQLPWILFVPSGEVGPRRAMWLVELSMLLMLGRAESVEALGRTWPLRSRAQREDSFRRLRGWLKAASAADRLGALASVRTQFPEGESDRLLEEFPDLRMLTWDELRELSRNGVEIGSHGCHHEMQSAVQAKSVRSEELHRSRVELEARLEKPCRAFAYPDGQFVETSPAEVEGAGYELAFTTEAGTIAPSAEARRYLLPRLAAPASLRGFVHGFWWDAAATPTTGRPQRVRHSEG